MTEWLLLQLENVFSSGSKQAEAARDGKDAADARSTDSKDYQVGLACAAELLMLTLVILDWESTGWGFLQLGRPGWPSLKCVSANALGSTAGQRYSDHTTH